MKELPILMNSAMVRATLASTKTQTRREIKLPPAPAALGEWQASTIGGENGGRTAAGNEVPLQAVIWHTRTGKTISCPHGQPGDRIWVRETHAQVFDVDIPAGRPVGPIGTAGSPVRPDWKSRYVYRADGEMPTVQWHHVGDRQPVRWTPSIHMPRSASRILLEIVSVRVERLNNCSAADATAEGVAPDQTRQISVFGANADERAAIYQRAAIAPFQRLWESINGADSWAANPWVWVIEFKRVPQHHHD